MAIQPERANVVTFMPRSDTRTFVELVVVRACRNPVSKVAARRGEAWNYLYRVRHGGRNVNPKRARPATKPHWIVGPKPKGVTITPQCLRLVAQCVRQWLARAISRA